MRRYYSHTVILPDETRLNDFVVEVCGSTVTWFPFTGEIHSTIYVWYGDLRGLRAEAHSIPTRRSPLLYASGDADDHATLYAYSLTPCPSCSEGWYEMRRL